MAGATEVRPVFFRSGTVGSQRMTKVASPKDIGQLIRHRRKEAGLTLKDAAGMAGVGVRFLSELERGKTTLQIGLVIEVLQLFGLELHVLLPSPTRRSLWPAKLRRWHLLRIRRHANAPEFTRGMLTITLGRATL